MAHANISRLLSLVVLSFVVAAFFLASGNAPKASVYWNSEVFADDLTRVDNIVVAPDRSLYVSLERKDGHGQIAHVRNGRSDIIMTGLRRPDGLYFSPPFLYVTEEVERGRVLRIDLQKHEQRVLAQLNKPEGIRPNVHGDLIISEDLAENGRIVSLSKTGRVTELASRLKKPEGLLVADDDSILFAESGAGRVVRITDGRRETVIDGLHSPDQIAMAPDGALWISEDRTRGKVYRYLNGRLETVMTGVRKAQGIAFDADGYVYIAEQGRNRILRLRPARYILQS